MLARFTFKRGGLGGSLTCTPTRESSNRGLSFPGVSTQGKEEVPRNPLEKPQEKPAETWAARRGEFLQKVTVFYIPSLCLQPARASMKDPYSSLPGTTQTAAAVVEGGPGVGVGEWGRKQPLSCLPFS